MLLIEERCKNMNDKKYVLQYVEAVNPVESKKMYWAKRIYIIIWILIIFFSLILQENIFIALSGVSKILLILLGIIIWGMDLKQARIPSELIIQFEKEYMSLFRKKHFYSRKNIIQELDTFKYDEIKECTYDRKNQKIMLKGKFHSLVYKYSKDGSLEKEPCFDDDRTGFRYFYTNLDQTDIVNEITTHSPIEVIIIN